MAKSSDKPGSVDDDPSKAGASAGAGADPGPPSGDASSPAGSKPSGISDDVKLQIEHARLQERNKLRDRIDKAENALKAAEERAAALTKQVEDMATKLSAFEEGAKQGGSKGIDVNAVIDRATTSAVSKTQEQFQKKLAEMEAKLAETENKRHELEIKLLRERLIADAGGSDAMIPELVSGSDEDTLKASVEAAKAAYARVISKAGIPGDGSAKPNVTPGSGAAAVGSVLPSGVGSVSPAAGTPGSGGSGGGILTGVKAMGLDDFKKARAEIKKAALARYKSQIGLE